MSIYLEYISQNAYVHIMSRTSTRERILDAVVELHEEVGPAETTITAIAERAGVQRLTVYRHFPDERELIRGCSAHWSARHPPPDPSSWAGVRDPRERLESALVVLYGYYAESREMLGSILRDEEKVPALSEVLVPFHAFLAEVAGGLSAGWGIEAPRQKLVRAAVGHALGFQTWESLSREGLAVEAAAGLMADLVACAGQLPPLNPRSGTPP